ncbi:MAG: hypothetical protein H0U76_21680 [Ktedonobacteraceae bacterium]|nr:hypothetical protein [Ktedonobacteraceae bacterium]
MATGSFRRDGTRVIIQVYDPAKGCNVKIPRKHIRQLDGASDDDIQRFINLYIQTHRLGAERVAKRYLAPTDEAEFTFEQFLNEYSKLRNTRPITRNTERYRWDKYIVPFFVMERSLKDVRAWENVLTEFAPHLMANSGLQINQIKKVLGLLKRFSIYLVSHRILTRRWELILPTENRASATPLPSELEPNTVLQFMRTATPRHALLAGLGFFASLRPEESFALTRAHFLTGSLAKDRAKTYTRFAQYGLGSGLSIFIDIVLSADGLDEPKTAYSKAVVNVWDKDAAVLIASLIKELPTGAVLFDGRSRDTLFKSWRKWGIPGYTLHDLRRASGLHLGRRVDIPVTLLQDHLRHADIKTTQLYMRAPTIDKGAVTQDFDDVG